MANAFEPYNWAWGISGLKPAEKLVLLAIASYADKRGVCYPSRRSLVEKTGLSENGVRVALRSLKKAGLVEITSQFDRATGRKTSSLYQLNLRCSQ